MGLATEKEGSGEKHWNYMTFMVNGATFGVDTRGVEEIMRTPTPTRIPLAPSHVCGLINLRGQIATAYDLRDLFFDIRSQSTTDTASMICRNDQQPIALVVDAIGEVVEVGAASLEAMPGYVPERIRPYLGEGVFQIPSAVVSIIDIEKIVAHIMKQD